jgi:23S rRNA (uracil1939-C5)-methyltransferase
MSHSPILPPMPRHRRKASAPKFSAAPFEVEIGSIGAQGDGVAAHERGKLFVPYTTAGDRVRVQRVTADRAMVVDWLAHGPHRQAPSCPHFGPGKCGGCALQHLDDGAYVDWKTGLVRDAIARAGFPDAALAPLARTPPGARRRAEFVAMTGRDVAAGSAAGDDPHLPHRPRRIAAIRRRPRNRSRRRRRAGVHRRDGA